MPYPSEIASLTRSRLRRLAKEQVAAATSCNSFVLTLLHDLLTAPALQRPLFFILQTAPAPLSVMPLLNLRPPSSQLHRDCSVSKAP